MRVRLTKKIGPYRKGQVVDFDPKSAAQLLDDGRGEAVDEPERQAFDPAEHTVPEVLEHLQAAAAAGDAAEVKRVQAAERAGKNRSGVLNAI